MVGAKYIDTDDEHVGFGFVSSRWFASTEKERKEQTPRPEAADPEHGTPLAVVRRGPLGCKHRHERG